jgi:hypothetical protein
MKRKHLVNLGIFSAAILAFTSCEPAKGNSNRSSPANPNTYSGKSYEYDSSNENPNTYSGKSYEYDSSNEYGSSSYGRYSNDMNRGQKYSNGNRYDDSYNNNQGYEYRNDGNHSNRGDNSNGNGWDWNYGNDNGWKSDWGFNFFFNRNDEKTLDDYGFSKNEVQNIYALQFNPGSIIRLDGQIVKVVKLKRNNQDYILLLVQSNQGLYLVNLGPVHRMGRLNLAEGDNITVMGSDVRSNGRHFLIATNVNYKGQNIQLRNEQGRAIEGSQGQMSPYGSSHYNQNYSLYSRDGSQFQRQQYGYPGQYGQGMSTYDSPYGHGQSQSQYGTRNY